jgi:cobalt-zinc-cadmium efflux system membrane fusion protein
MMFKRTFHIIIFIFLALGTATLVSCGSKKTEKAAEEEDHHDDDGNAVELTDAQYNTVGIQLGQPELREISGTVKVNGYLDVPPQQMASISVPMGGFIKQTALLQGMAVNKGQALAVLENMDYIQLQEDYLDIKSQLEYAKAEYERQQELAKENVNAQKTLQQSKATFQSLTVKHTGLREKLGLLNVNMPTLEKGTIQRTVSVYSPISGYVTQVNVNPGQFVNPIDILFRIVNTEHLHAELTVFEKDIPKLKIGQKVRFTLAGETKERLATLHLIGREISPERTVRVHCHLEQEDKQLLPGAYLQAVIETGEAKVTAVPDAAIVNFENKYYIFVNVAVGVDPGHGAPGHKHDEPGHQHEATEKGTHHFLMMEVKKGNSESGYTAITLPAEVPANASIVVKGAYDLLAAKKNSGGHAH